jgi:mannose/fructose-specific phosphotransferase system component IIA
MIPVLVLTHGNLASELLQAAQTIDPSLSGRTAAMSLPWDVDSDEASRSLKKQLRELDQGEGAVNLPMLVKLGSLQGRSMSLDELATGLTAAGQKSIRVASEFLHAKSSGSG